MTRNTEVVTIAQAAKFAIDAECAAMDAEATARSRRVFADAARVTLAELIAADAAPRSAGESND